MNSTIVAIATPPGQGGVGIIRISGPKAVDIATKISTKKKFPPREALFSSFYDDNELIDQGLLLYFKAPHSFTGEDVVEFQTHGSPVVLDLLVKACIKAGAELAKPGEFSERAFLNDKIDLAQAEAIADLIAAQSQSSAKMALQSLQGVFSQHIHNISDQLIHLRLYVEAAIDFPEEEIDFLSDGKVKTMLDNVIASMQSLRQQTHQGVVMQEGIKLVIAGRPNAGKSTLINQLAGREVAIVTDIAGTTRDVMREHILIDDIPVHLIDTAGIRESEDLVEREGIRRAWSEITEADAVLLIIDLTSVDQQNCLSKELLDKLPPHTPILRLLNKIDKLEKQPTVREDEICISAKSGSGIDQLKERVKKIAGLQQREGVFLARRRHLDAMDEALNLMLTGKKQLDFHRAGELLAEDLRLAHEALCRITGEFSSDDLLGEIFSSFCIGK